MTLMEGDHETPNAQLLYRLFKKSVTEDGIYTPMSTYEKFVSANNYNREHEEKRAPNARLVQALKMFANRPSFENSFKFRGKSFVQPNQNVKFHDAFGK